MTSGRTGASRESVDPSVREILRLKHACGASDRAIARSLSLVGSTVGLTRSGPRRRTCVGRCRRPRPTGCSEAMLYTRPRQPAGREAAPGWGYVHDELRGPGVMLMMLWE